MIERIEFDGDLYAKINEIIDHLNDAAEEDIEQAMGMSPLMMGPRPVAPKWKVGEMAWYIDTSYIVYDRWGVGESEVSPDDVDDCNYFKSKESAEACLAEIKAVMEKYE